MDGYGAIVGTIIGLIVFSGIMFGFIGLELWNDV